MTAPLLYAALGIEARAVRRGWRGADVTVIGIGGKRLDSGPAASASARPVVLFGFCGALDAARNPGDVVVATAIDDGSVIVDLPAAQDILGVLRRGGIAASGGIVFCSKHIVRGNERQTLAGRATAVDMESGPALAAVGANRLAVVRVVVDTPRHGLVRASLFSGRRVWRALREVGAALASGYEATDQRVSTSGNVDLAARASQVSRVSLQAGAHVAGPTEKG
ncbi:MAG: hypothetical protein ACRDV3_16045 [Acidothermaceae bacterium]